MKKGAISRCKQSAKKQNGSKNRRWKAEPQAIFRLMGMQQQFAEKEQTTLNLPVREALQSMRDGDGQDVHWNMLAAVANLCEVCGERIAPQVVRIAKDGQVAALDVLDRHQRTGRWSVTDANFVDLEACIELREQLIALSTPAQMMRDLRETMARMQADSIIKPSQSLNCQVTYK